MPSPAPNSGSPENRDTNSANPDKPITQEINIYPTTVKLKIPTNVFEASAWGNIATNHFAYDTTAFELIHKAEEKLVALTELGEHYYDVINRSTYQLSKVDEKEWLRFLAAGPDNNIVLNPKKEPINPLEVAYANLLFSASCLCRADAVEDHSSNLYKRWREAGFITSAHAINLLNSSMQYESLAGPMPLVQIKERLEDIARNNHGRSVRLDRAIYELVESFDTVNAHLASIIKEHGTIGDRIFSLSSKSLIENFDITRKNHQRLRTLQEEVRLQTTQDTWINADDEVVKLASSDGGHLSCLPDAVFRSETLMKACLGIIREINNQADHIILMGMRWVDPLVKLDPAKRSAEDIVKVIHYWLEDSDPAITLQSILRIPTESDLVDGVYTFFRHLKNNQSNARATLEINTNPDLTNHFDETAKVVIVGDNSWSSFFLNNKYVSVYLTNTKPENTIDFSIPPDSDSGIKYVKVAMYNVASEPDRGPGAWKSCYISGPGIHQVISSVKWDKTDEQFYDFTRTPTIKDDQPYSDRYHNHYIFIHNRKEEPKRVAKMQPRNRLVNT